MTWCQRDPDKRDAHEGLQQLPKAVDAVLQVKVGAHF